MSYDKSKHTTIADVKKEFGDIVEAVKAHGDVSAEAQEAAAAAADLVVDTATDLVEGAKAWFKTKLGYQLHDPHQGVTISPTDATEATMNKWMKVQIEAGLIEQVEAPAAAPAPAEKSE